MDEFLIWLLCALALGLGGLAGWRVHRWHKQAAAKARALAEAATAAKRAEARRLAAEHRAASEREAAVRAEAERAAAGAARVQAEAERAAAAEVEARRLAAVQADVRRVAAVREEAARAASTQAEVERRAAEDAARRSAAPRPATAAKSAEQTLVMVADDSKVVRIKTGRLLAQHRYRVCYAADGLDAAQQLQANVPDVVITDVEMPGMDGFELTRHIRGNPATAHVPVIMITAADDRHQQQSEQVGVSVLLGKPYPDEALITHIRRAMGQDQAPALIHDLAR